MSTVDKTEYHLKLEEINRLVDAQDYEGALTVADSIDWRRVKSVRTLCMVADIYEVNGELEKSMQMLQLAYKRSSIGKMILYRQVELALKMGLYDDAVKYYNQYLETASNDTSKYILKYKIYKAQKAPLENQIAILEEYKEREYTERWVYELAKLYKKAGQEKKCVETCDDLVLWFGEGKYVTKAMELKMTYTPLSPSQKEKYEKAKAAGKVAKATAGPKLTEEVKNTILPGVSAAAMAGLQKVEEEKEQTGFRAPGFFIAFNPETGKMVSLRYAGTDMIYNKEGFDFNWFRAMDNDKRDYLPTTVKKQSFDWKQSADKKSVIVTTSLEATVGNGDKKVVLPFDVTYTVYANGTVDVDATFKTGDDFNLPRLGLQVALNPRLEQVEWYGRGPIENYWDRKNAAYVGLYKNTVTGMEEAYVRAQSMGNRDDVRWLTLKSLDNQGIRITSKDHLNFSALHFTDPELWELTYGHDLDNIRRAEVILNLDCIQRGIGNGSCGPGPRPHYEIEKNKNYSYSFRIENAK